MEDIIFNSNVIEKGLKNGNKYLLLDKTYFYPDGKGGQLGDRGDINGKKVLYVYEEVNKIYHFVEDYPENINVNARIDGKRRKDISIQHTSQHILSRIILNLFNKETLSFHMGEDYSTLDIEYYDFTENDIRKIEEEANKIVSSGKGVKIYYIDKEDIKKFELRKEIDLFDKIRIVDIENFDKTMCGGTHVDNTIEIKLIKIIKFEKHKKNMIRIYYLGGDRAILDYTIKSEILEKLKNRFSIGANEIENFINNILNERDNLSKKIKIFKEIYINKLIEENKDKEIYINYLSNLDENDLIYLSKKLINDKTKFIFIYNDEFGIINKNKIFDLNLSEILNELKDKFNIKGGGKDYISLKIENKGKEIEKFLWEKVKLQ
jgi:alanyl-tRNA synthetase